MLAGMDIGALLREQREIKGLTQREFSERAGVSRTTVGHYESGRRTPSFAAVEALLGGIGLQLCCAAEPLWADVDREIAALRDVDLDERIKRVPVWLDWWHERLAGLPHAMDGPLAALVQGAPVPARWLDLAVPRTALDGLAGALTGIMNLGRWSRNWNDWGYSDCDPREPGPLRWRCAYGELRVRLFDQPVQSIDLMVQREAWPVRPLSDVESDDPWVTRVLARMRAGLPSAA
jgi:transcriptional regulator with XRE-family HTH domain